LADPSSAPIRAVFDNNVLLQAMSNANGPAGACVQAVRDGRIRLCMSRDLIAEFADDVSRPQLIRKLHLTESGTAQFIAEMEALAELIDPVAAVFHHPIDPKDSMVVNLAIAASASVITTHDRHLLALRDPTDPVGIDFMSHFGSIEVLTPVQLLERVRSR
jgi:putative PIN family toxin of toxin-antitoxin system